MSNIGQTGKRSQNFGQGQQRRYQLGYHAADSTPLQAKLQRRAEPVPTRSHAEASAPAQPVNPSSAFEVEASVEPTMTAVGTIQRVENEPTESSETSEQGSGGAAVKPEDVANRVFAMLMRDLRHERERMGNPHIR